MNKVICLKKYKQCKRHNIPIKAAIKIAKISTTELSVQEQKPKRRNYKTRGKLTIENS